MLASAALIEVVNNAEEQKRASLQQTQLRTASVNRVSSLLSHIDELQQRNTQLERQNAILISKVGQQ